MTGAGSQQSPLLRAAGFRHAFFTRQGGVSEGPYASLNFSVPVGDAPERVAENLRRAAAALGVEPGRLYFLSQIHGRDVVVLDGAEERETVLHRQGDAVASRTPGVACSVRIADCVPVLVADRSSGAVAAAHAGWRGVAAGVAAETVRTLRSMIGDEGDLIAAIGPHISVAAFEVSEDVAAQLLAASPDPDVVDRGYGPKPHVDLRRILRAQLRELGLPDDAIDDVRGCTVGDPEHYFSFRRDGKQSGRHLAAIVAR